MFDRLPNCKDFICKWEMQDAEGVCGLMGGFMRLPQEPKGHHQHRGNLHRLQQWQTGRVRDRQRG